MASSFVGFLDHTRHITVGRTPLDEWSARRRHLYLTTHNTHNKHPLPDSTQHSQQTSTTWQQTTLTTNIHYLTAHNTHNKHPLPDSTQHSQQTSTTWQHTTLTTNIHYLTAHNTHNKHPLPDSTQHSQQTSMPPVGFESTISPAGERAADRRLRQRGHWDRQPTHAPDKIQFATNINPLHVSTPGCHSQGFFSDQRKQALLSLGRLEHKNSTRHQIERHKITHCCVKVMYRPWQALYQMVAVCLLYAARCRELAGSVWSEQILCCEYVSIVNIT